jgi:glycosyltransferase involved in cell wall biosynthesis
MKVLHVPFCFRPDPVGGTEVYVEALAREQVAAGTQVVVAAPGAANVAYAVDGLPVRRFATGQVCDLNMLYGAGDGVASAGFARVLDDEKPDIVHLHAWTSAVSIRLVDEARRRAIPVVFTYHTPTVSCQRGTLLWRGREVCDGKLQVRRCTECALEGLGAGRLGSVVLSRVPATVGGVCSGLGRAGSSLWTALRYSHLVQTQHAAVHQLLSSVQCIVALCAWTRELLIRNGAPDEKIVICRHGLSDSLADGITSSAERAHAGALRVAFLGRLHPTKGPDVLAGAMQRLSGKDIELHLFGIEQPGDAGYASSLRRLVADDGRVCFHEPVPASRVIPTLREFDVLAVPSQWLETGPLVVLEAFAAQKPVIGSRLGGIAELVRDGVDGLLVQHDSIDEWARALGRVADDPELLGRLCAGVRPPRRMRAVRDDMQAVYVELAGQPGPVHSAA